MAGTCDTNCLTCSDVREIASTTDVGAINENFSNLQSDLTTLIDLVKLYIVNTSCSSASLDANFGCVTNVKDCCDDPSSAMPRSGVEQMIREILAEGKNSCKGCNTCKPKCGCKQHTDCKSCGSTLPNAY